MELGLELNLSVQNNQDFVEKIGFFLIKKLRAEYLSRSTLIKRDMLSQEMRYYNSPHQRP
jgi:hypothetical protein